MAGANTLEFTDANFEADVLKSEVPVLVDFWAEWCMPCRALGPLIDEVAVEYNGKAKVGKLDIDNNQNTASTYGIQMIPSVLIFKGGEIVQKFTGMRAKKDFIAALDTVLAG